MAMKSRYDTPKPNTPWWKNGSVYQIYPASYNDSNNDGIGDIQGIIQKLDYIKDLGVDIIWVCPHFDSPQIDMGYDISDYQAIYPPYGTVADCERLISECHLRELRVCFDLVVNHTSDKHKWFQQSRSSKNNPKRDWYIWRPAKYDAQGNRKPPNNWRSNFAGPAWSWDEETQEYYLHLFAPEQPDLNWDNDEVRQTIYDDIIRFWLKKGVDGFRVDTVNMYSKGDMKDAPISDPESECQSAGMMYCNGPRMHEFLREMNAVMEEYDAMTVGECPCTPDMDKVKKYVSASERQLSMVFQFDVVDIGQGMYKYQTVPFNWRFPDFKAAVERTQSISIGGDCWTTAFLENHDQARAVSRFGRDTPEFRNASAKMLALMLASLTGTLNVYQGQEIGMANAPLSWDIEEYKDLDSINYYEMVRKRTGGDKNALEDAKIALQHLARDHSRLPMQWDSSTNGGFSEAKPWMRANDDYPEVNVASQQDNPQSVLSFWKAMLKLRKANLGVLAHGDFKLLDRDDMNIFAYTKTFDNQQALVVLNFSTKKQPYSIPEDFKSAELLAGTRGDATGAEWEPFEGRIYLK